MLVNFHVNVCDDCGKNEVDKAFSHPKIDIKTDDSVNTYIKNIIRRDGPFTGGLLMCVNNFSS